MMSLLGQTLDQTARSSLIKDLKRQLILRAAKDLTCDKVFTGECATSLAITLLSGKAMYIRLADMIDCDRHSSETGYERLPK